MQEVREKQTKGGHESKTWSMTTELQNKTGNNENKSQTITRTCKIKILKKVDTMQLCIVLTFPPYVIFASLIFSILVPRSLSAVKINPQLVDSNHLPSGRESCGDTEILPVNTIWAPFVRVILFTWWIQRPKLNVVFALLWTAFQNLAPPLLTMPVSH